MRDCYIAHPSFGDGFRFRGFPCVEEEAHGDDDGESEGVDPTGVGGRGAAVERVQAAGWSTAGRTWHMGGRGEGRVGRVYF